MNETWEQRARLVLRVASEALGIAADWNVDRMELEIPESVGVEIDPEEEEPGWYNTRSVADAMKALANEGIMDNTPVKMVITIDPSRCQTCAGRGRTYDLDHEKWYPCDKCDGTGENKT